MIKTKKITFKVFLFQRVKKKIMFFNTETYPLQIRLTAGTRTLYLKSYFFNIMLQNKYQQQALYSHRPVSIENIIDIEEKLMQYILEKENAASSLDRIRHEYNFFSYDILHELDEQFKKFMIGFFLTENLPAYSLFIKNDGNNHTSEFILNNLEKSLQPVVYEKLLHAAVEKAPPYIPFISFFHEKLKTPLPVLPVYQWRQEAVSTAFAAFIEEHFPQYKPAAPEAYIDQLLQKLS